MKPDREEHFDRPVRDFARPTGTVLPEDMAAGEALQELRSRAVGERIFYLYVADAEGRLRGVVPMRRLILARAGDKLGDLAHAPVISCPGDLPLQRDFGYL